MYLHEEFVLEGGLKVLFQSRSRSHCAADQGGCYGDVVYKRIEPRP